MLRITTPEAHLPAQSFFPFLVYLQTAFISILLVSPYFKGKHSRLSGTRLSLSLGLCVPKPRLVRRKARLVPHIDEHILRLRNIILILLLLDPNLHPVLAKAYVLPV
jgi:hypothetical protein